MSSEEYQKFWFDIIRIVDTYRGNTNLSLIERNFDSPIANAFYAGTVEFLKNESNQKPPKWVFKKKYYLKTPWFANNFKSLKLKILIMIETPVEYKTRNIFLSENTFSRC